MSPFLKYFESPSALFKAYTDYLPITFKYIMYESLTTNNTAPDNHIENTAPQETTTTKDAHNIKILQELIEISSGNTSNEIMINKSNNAENFPSRKKYDDDASNGAQSYSDGPHNALNKLITI